MTALEPVAQRYALNLQACTQDDSTRRLESFLAVVGEIWRAMCISIVSGDHGAQTPRNLNWSMCSF
eukprot:843799-Amphidinium_carterae.1